MEKVSDIIIKIGKDLRVLSGFWKNSRSGPIVYVRSAFFCIFLGMLAGSIQGGKGLLELFCLAIFFMLLAIYRKMDEK